jgi:hypothetical protein
MKLTKLIPEQKQSLKAKKEYHVAKWLNYAKIDKQKAVDVIRFVYSLIKRPMPTIYEASNPLEAQRLANKLKGTSKKFYPFGTYLTSYWASFYAYYDTFVDFGIITNEKFPKYFELRKVLDSNIFLTIEFDKAIILVGKPEVCLKNKRGLHCLTGKAIRWADGYGYHYVNGRRLPEKYFLSISDKTYSMDDFIREENEEYKSTCIAFMQEKYGEEYLVNFFREHLKEVDSFTDKKDQQYLQGTTGGMNVGVYTLFKGKINGESIAYVRCYCPSTDRMFFLGVDSVYTKAKDAIASLYRIPAKLKPHIESISRQGERFSTILSEEGLKLAKSLPEEDIKNVTHLTGAEYFKKMKYEY